MLQMIIDNIYNFLDSITETIESIFNMDNNLSTNLAPMIITNSLYDMYYCLSLLITDKKIEGIVLGPFHYPDSFNIYICDTKFFVEVKSCIIKDNYYIYTSVMTKDEAVKIPDLGYINLYKEQSNNETFIEDIILTKEYITDVFE